MSRILESLIGSRVELFLDVPERGSPIEGVLKDIDGQVVSVEVGGQTSIFPLAAIRMVRVLE